MPRTAVARSFTNQLADSMPSNVIEQPVDGHVGREFKIACSRKGTSVCPPHRYTHSSRAGLERLLRYCARMAAAS